MTSSRYIPTPRSRTRFWPGYDEQPLSAAIRILGIDPGSRITGYGVIDSRGQRNEYVTSGCIEAGSVGFPQRLQRIFDAVHALVRDYQPAEVAVERVFVKHNADSALKLGQARAAAICATFGVPLSLHEYAARAVKQAVVGTGGADKRQVQEMVRMLLRLAETPAPDAADALAVALCHAHSRGLAGLRAAGLASARGTR